jgi:HD-GYP domain-containing protein (c-di-GMP phosphodiesterase class II)
MPNRFYIRKASSHTEAKILSVADAYSTMSAGRIYRPARPTSMVLEELRNKSGFQFSPEIVQAAIKASNSLTRS